MEYVRGMGLSEVLGGLKRLSESAALEIALQTAQGLGAAADRGVIHRDIKPANLMLTEDVTVKVADFGLAKALDSKAGGGLTATGKIVGTPSYMSPEQAESQPTDLRSDIFSMGVTLFESVTGSKPFVAESIVGVLREVVDTPAPDPREFRDDLSDDTAQAILRMLEKNPDDRYPSYPELIQDLLMSKRALPKEPGYLDSIRIYIQTDLQSRDEMSMNAGPVGNNAQTLKFGLSGATAPMRREPSLAGLPPKPPEKKSSSKPLVVGSVAGTLLLVGAVLTFLFLTGNLGDRKITLPDGGLTSFNLAVTTPKDGAVVPLGKVKIEGSFSGKSPEKILVLDKPAWLGEGNFRTEIELKKGGEVSIPVVATSLDGAQEKKVVRLSVDDTPPQFEFESRVQEGRITIKDREFTISGRLVDANPEEVLVNKVPVKTKTSGGFRYQGTMEGEGSVEYLFEGKDMAGLTVSQKVEVRRDATPPEVKISNLPPTVLSIIPEVEFDVTVNEPVGRLLVNDKEMSLTTHGAGTHRVRVTLVKGMNSITVVAEDEAGHRTTGVEQVSYQDLRTEEGKEVGEKFYRKLKRNLRGAEPDKQLTLLRSYKEEFPETQHTEEIDGLIEEAEKLAEEVAWERVEEAVTADLSVRIDALQDYLGRFPKGNHVDEAQTDLDFFDRLKSRPAKLVSGPQPGIWINPHDGAELVKVSQGRFTLAGEPVRRVWLDGYYIYRAEVTQGRYLKFLEHVDSILDEKGRPFIARPDNAGLKTHPWGIARKAGKWILPTGMENHPAVFVTWYGAVAYARWAGGYLPSEAQWEAAVNPALRPRKYPWGNLLGEKFAWYIGNSKGSIQPVKTCEANIRNIYDLSGNAWEWCRDSFDPEFPKSADAKKDNVLNLASSALRSVRGGGWNSPPEQLQLPVRTGINPLFAGSSLGFRVVIPMK
jgi:serine/threonine protein kinase/formylglycine-generating enzyme required for sulfatase activity